MTTTLPAEARPTGQATHDQVILPTPAQRQRGMLFLRLAAGSVGFAMTLQMGLNANFVGQTLGLTGYQQGILEACRESCGIMALFILAAMAGLAEPIIAASMLVLLAAGLSAYMVVSEFWWVIAASLVWSQGLHVWMPLPNSMAMALAEPCQTGRRLGQVAASGAIGAFAGLVTALVLHLLGVQLRSLWLLGGVAALLAAGACLGIPRNIKARGQRLVIRREYRLYYLLCFLEGWRKQIFVAFAGFLLVKEYGTPLSTMLLLWIAIQIIGWFSAPTIGRLLDRVGERRVLAVYYAGLVWVFVGYAFVPIRAVLYTLFVLDSALFMMAMGLNTYVNRIAPSSEHTPTLSLGVAINHVAAVAMPLAGGIMWKYAGYRWAFLLGAAVAVVSIFVALRLPMHRHPTSPTSEPAKAN